MTIDRLLTIALFFYCTSALAQPSITLRLDQQAHAVPSNLCGLMTEEINYSYDGGFNRHFLIAHRCARRFSESTDHHLSSAGAQAVGHYHDVAGWIFFQIVGVYYQKANAFKVGSLLGRPNCADDFS